MLVSTFWKKDDFNKKIESTLVRDPSEDLGYGKTPGYSDKGTCDDSWEDWQVEQTRKKKGSHIRQAVGIYCMLLAWRPYEDWETST